MEIVFKKSAEKELLKLEKLLGQRILQKIAVLKEDPIDRATEKLGGDKGYRIRIGNYRVIYTVDKIAKSVTIIKVAHRRDVYRP